METSTTKEHESAEFNNSLLKALRKAMGYVEDGSNQSFSIGQDEATKDYIFTCGKAFLFDQSLLGLYEQIVEHYK